MNELKHAIEMADIAYSLDYTDDARLTLLERKVDAIIEYLLNREKCMDESKPASYYGPQSNYYLERTWEEYHKMKEELADTKCKLAQAEDMIDTQRTLIKQIHTDEDTLIQAIKPLSILVDAAKELEHSMADAYAVNKVRQAYKHIEETWEDVRARCS